MTTDTSKSAGTQAEGEESSRPEARPGPARRWAAIGTSGLALLPLALLGAAFWIGRLVRPGGDDWCFLTVVRDGGASGMIGKFFLHDNGRIANALLVIGYGSFGVPGHQWFALVSGVLMLGILWALIASALKRAGLTAPRGLALLVGATTAALFFFATPNPYKAFYWPASSVSHTVAPVLACAAVIPLLRARTRRGRDFALGVGYLAGIFIGTLSEETAIVAFVVLAAVLLLSRWALPGAGRTRTRVWCVVAFAGVAVGTVILYLSPGARTRRGRFGADSASMFGPETLTTAMRAFGHVLGTIFTTWQYLGAVAVGVLLGLLVRGGERGTDAPEGSLRRRPFLLVLVGFLAFLVSGYLCVVVAYPAFGASVATASRIWGDFLLLYVLLLVGVGALSGRALRARRWGIRAATATAAGVVCAATCVGLAVPLLRLERQMEVRAQRWDRQDRSLRNGAAHGAEVLPYTPVSVSGMLEPFGNHGRRAWPAQCVAQYYHLKKITHSTRLP
ncbi:DUF6056 family protein [Streptomyces sanglieri]|uniref:DUF6056 family protein n=1 Tax=Streptomyces sanglieri TaxID=193460 RepID=A0ABW2X0K9_9ACTN|nr:DUF6056 family protein [Streptomyces sp. Wh19]MDV9198007.1 DUF6056 family protein [Streptomyces sp. Wh19]